MHSCDNVAHLNPRYPVEGATIYLLEFEPSQYTEFMLFSFRHFPGDMPKHLEYSLEEIFRDKVYVRLSRYRVVDEAELQQWLIDFEKEHKIRPPVFVIQPK